MEQKSIYEQIYERINSLFGTLQEDEYLTLVCRGKPIHVDLLEETEEGNITRIAEEDRLTNCVCEPYQVVTEVLPYTLSSRYAFALSMWTSQRQMNLVKAHSMFYESTEALLRSARRSLQKADEIDRGVCEAFNDQDVYAWKEAYKRLLDTAGLLYQHFDTSEHEASSFGEDELLEAKALLKKQKIMLPSKQYAYPVMCEPKTWTKQLASSFQKQDLLPSVYDVVKQLLELAESIEDGVKKLLFDDQNTTPEMDAFKEIRKGLIEDVIQMTKEMGAYDQQQVFIMVNAFGQVSNLHAKTLYCIQKFLHKKYNVRFLRDIFEKSEHLHEQYWNAMHKLLQQPQSDPVVNENRKNMIRNTMALEEMQQVLYQADRKALIKRKREKELLPFKLTTGYDYVLCASSFQAFYQDSGIYHKEGTMDGLKAFFGERIPYDMDEDLMKFVDIRTGFQVMQVEIHRSWMVEDIFSLSSAFERLCNEKIAQGIMQLPHIPKKTILPSYPIRMVIAKDITICLDFSKAGKKMMQLVKNSAVHGYGFLCFRESSSTFVPHIERDGLILTLRYPKAYVIGYFMRYTPKDKSQKIGGDSYARK